MRRRRLWVSLLGFFGSILVAVIFAAWPGRSTFTVGPETTYVTGPLDKHGYVDYVTALNERLRGDIKPENNANVLIWQALGPHPEGGTMPDEYFQWLGIGSPPEKGEYWVSWRNYLEERQKNVEAIEPAPKKDREINIPRRPWTAKDDPELADWLKLNEKPLALIVEATRRPEYYNPLVPTRTEDWSPGLLAAMLPNVQKCREVAAALASRAILRVAEEQENDAWQDLLACHRLGRLLARGATLIEMLVGIAIDGNSSDTDVAFLDHAKLTSAQVLECWHDLRKLPSMPPVADKIDLGERFNLLEILMLTARHGTAFLEGMKDNSAPPKGNKFAAKLFTRSINWDPAFRKANRWYDRYCTGLRIPDRGARVQEMAAIAQDAKTLKRQVTATGFIEKSFMGSESRGEMIGNIMIAMMLPAFDKIQGAAERCEQWQRNLHLAFALAAYQRDHGQYPATLDELAPKYLEQIPDDLFSGKPLIYCQEDHGFLLYSVGLNGIDEDGRTYGDDPSGDDIRVRMPVREPGPKK
jgi:hypothetical protein